MGRPLDTVPDIENYLGYRLYTHRFRPEERDHISSTIDTEKCEPSSSTGGHCVLVPIEDRGFHTKDGEHVNRLHCGYAETAETRGRILQWRAVDSLE